MISELIEITGDYSDLTFDKRTSILAAQRKHAVQKFEAFPEKRNNQTISDFVHTVVTANTTNSPHKQVVLAERSLPQLPRTADNDGADRGPDSVE